MTDAAAPSRLLTWTAYLLLTGVGYLIYAIGFITPYVEESLGVPKWVAALPNSTQAVGLMIGGILARRFVVRYGGQVAARTWAALMAGSAILLALNFSILPILLGALLFGIATGGTIVHVNSAIGRARGGTLLVRANMWSVTAGTLGPLVLSAFAQSIGWSWGALVPVPFLLALAFVMPASPARDLDTVDGAPEPPLPRAFWLTWAFLFLSTSAEFSFVTWGAQVATARTEMLQAGATGLAALYVVGMVLGRLLLSTGFGAGGRNLSILRGSAVLATGGALVLWLGSSPIAAGLGLFLGGLGISGIYPLGASLALSHAPLAPIRAASRLSLASGMAIFSAPLVLGLIAGSTGIVGAWALILGVLAIAAVLVWRVPRPAP